MFLNTYTSKCLYASSSLAVPISKRGLWKSPNFESIVSTYLGRYILLWGRARALRSNPAFHLARFWARKLITSVHHKSQVFGPLKARSGLSHLLVTHFHTPNTVSKNPIKWAISGPEIILLFSLVALMLFYSLTLCKV